jgi:methyl-accepting chemotaxis protein
MTVIRRILGVLVMCAGILGLVLSLAGLIAVWVVKPTIASVTDATIVTLKGSIGTSQKAMEVTGQALGATVESVDALSTMLDATATSLEDTQPVLDQVNSFMGEKLPATMQSATDSLKTAQQGAEVLDSTIKSLDSFRTVLSAVPLVGAFVEQPKQAYNPEKPLAESLGELAVTLEDLPDMFTEMSVNLDKADDNLATIKSSLTTMSGSVGLISKSLGEYQAMITQSKSSMDNLSSMLTNVQNNLARILNGAAIVLSLFFFWLPAAQVVIFSQGWELFQGTAGRMEGGEKEPPPPEPAAAA